MTKTEVIMNKLAEDNIIGSRTSQGIGAGIAAATGSVLFDKVTKRPVNKGVALAGGALAAGVFSAFPLKNKNKG